jgi:transcriptional regulator with XRE-family HTH domain
MKVTSYEAEIRRLFSKNLKRLRIRANLSQLSLALKADLTHTFINDIENCKRWFSPESLAKLALALDATPNEFFQPDYARSVTDDEHFSGYDSEMSNMVGDIRQAVDDITRTYLDKTRTKP